MKIAAVIVAAGNGTRMGGKKNKVFLKLGEKTVIEYTLNTFLSCGEFDDVILVTRECDIALCKKFKNIRVIPGGKTRQESVYLGLCEAREYDIAVIHDGARALIDEKTIKAAIADAKKYGAAAVGVPVKDTLKCVGENGFIEKTLDRSVTYQIQTPQVFSTSDIIRAHELAARDGFSATDDCALYEKYIGKIKLTEGSYQNIKLTTPEDMAIAKNILKNTRLMKLIRARRKFNDSVKLVVQKCIASKYAGDKREDK